MNKEALKIIDKQIQILNNITVGLDYRLPKWKDNVIKALSKYVSNEELEMFSVISTPTWETDRTAYKELLEELKINLNEIPEEELIKEELPVKSKRNKDSNNVFVIHGHDALARIEVARVLEKLGLNAIILHEQPNEGKTIIEKFERDAAQVGYAIAIFTPDDTGYPINKPNESKSRARQNVILELGYFSGILGRKNVLVLYKDDVEIPSDYLGVVYVPIDSAGAWKFSMAKELKQAGMNLDLNKLI